MSSISRFRFSGGPRRSFPDPSSTPGVWTKAIAEALLAANRERLAEAIGLGGDAVVLMNQVHGDRVVRVDEPSGAAVDGTDGLVTATPRLALAVVTADCVPVLMGDARAGVVAAVHAGRVGAQKGVVARAVEAMVEVGAHVEDVSVLLGPSVSGANSRPRSIT